MSRNYFKERIIKTLNFLKKKNIHLSLSFVDDTEIRKLNKKFRKKNKATDVLSFPMESDDFLGDIIISLDTAKKQANKERQTLRQRAWVLTIHGLLHLFGYDHIRDDDWLKMSELEKKIFKYIQ